MIAEKLQLRMALIWVLTIVSASFLKSIFILIFFEGGGGAE